MICTSFDFRGIMQEGRTTKIISFVNPKDMHSTTRHFFSLFYFLIIFSSVVLALLALFSFHDVVVAQTDKPLAGINGEKTITAQDLGISEPKLLPSNPLYFVKNIVRGVKKLFTRDPIKKIELELKFADEKILETEMVAERAPENTKALERALVNYQSSQEDLKERLAALKETSGNPNVDKLVEKITDRVIKHEVLFDELQAKIGDTSVLREKLELAKETREDAFAEAAKKDEIEKFAQRFNRVISESKAGGLKNGEKPEFVQELTRKVADAFFESTVLETPYQCKGHEKKITALREQMAQDQITEKDFLPEAEKLQSSFVLCLRQEAGTEPSTEGSEKKLPVVAVKPDIFSPDWEPEWWPKGYTPSCEEIRQALKDLTHSWARQDISEFAYKRYKEYFEKLLDECFGKVWGWNDPEIRARLLRIDCEEKYQELVELANNLLLKKISADEYRMKREELRRKLKDCPPLPALAERSCDDLFDADAINGADFVAWLIDYDEFSTHVDAIGEMLKKKQCPRYRGEPSTRLPATESREYVESQPFLSQSNSVRGNCALFEESQRFYFDLCAKDGYENVCLDGVTGVFQGCTRDSQNDCTDRNMNRDRNLLCGAKPYSAPSKEKEVLPPSLPPSPSPASDECNEIEAKIKKLTGAGFGDDVLKIIAELQEKLAVCRGGGAPLDKPQIGPCSNEYRPVCGLDGKTYKNSCFAKSAGVEGLQYEGECGKPVEPPSDQDEGTMLKSDPLLAAFVTIKEDGTFDPPIVIIKKGGTVTWGHKKEGMSFRPASNDHPTHTIYPGFDALQDLGYGETYSFAFHIIGIWGYHDHLHPSITGKVQVIE